jgi:hypothetical protein
MTSGDNVVEAVVTAYLIGWVVSTVAIYLASRRLGDAQNPAPHQLVLSTVAGGLWPLLLLGVVEFSSVAAASSAASHLRSDHGELVSAGVLPLR